MSNVYSFSISLNTFMVKNYFLTYWYLLANHYLQVNNNLTGGDSTTRDEQLNTDYLSQVACLRGL